MEVSQTTTDGAAALLQIKARPGFLYTLTGFNTGPAQYIQIYDLATTPTSQKPKVVTYVPANSAFSLDYIRIPRKFSAGIFVGNSSTALTYTAGAADCLFDAMYT